MDKELLRVSQYILKHPIRDEGEEYKKQYINTLEYFVRKYSLDDIYSCTMLELYKNKLIEHPELYKYEDKELKKISKGVIRWKIKKFKFFSYRYCLIVDVIFICSFNDIEKSKKIYEEIKEIYGKRYWKRLDALFDVIIGERENCESLDQVEYMLQCIKQNRLYINKKNKNILVTANMSAGKSTLLNAIVGKKVNKTQNDACTAKTHYLLNKAFEDNLSYEYDHDLELDATQEILMEDNSDNLGNEIFVGTKFRSIENSITPICFIDTPGVNSSQDEIHKEISQKNILNLEYDILMYVMNGENIGTDDDYKHLKFVSNNYQGKIIFVVNKLDRYRKEDSVIDTLEQVKKDLQTMGYKSPIICPVSAYAAYLAKMEMFGEKLDDDEMDELHRFYRKLNRGEYQFNQYYPKEFQELNVSEDKNQQLLLHSGILSLEKILYEERKIQ